MANVIAHEISEASTDPDSNAWFDANGQEDGDKCTWDFGNTYRLTNGSSANVHLGNRDFLLQRLWVNSGAGYCSLNLGNPTDGSVIRQGEALYPGQSVVSPNGRYTLIFQNDGNVVLYRPGGRALWASHTQGSTFTGRSFVQLGRNSSLHVDGEHISPFRLRAR